MSDQRKSSVISGDASACIIFSCDSDPSLSFTRPFASDPAGKKRSRFQDGCVRAPQRAEGITTRGVRQGGGGVSARGCVCVVHARDADTHVNYTDTYTRGPRRSVLRILFEGWKRTG